MDRILSTRAVSPAEEAQASGSHQQASSSSATPVQPWPNAIEAANQQRALREHRLTGLYRTMLEGHAVHINLASLCVSARDFHSGIFRLTLEQYEQLQSCIRITRRCCRLEYNMRWRTHIRNVCAAELLMMRWIALEQATADDNANPLDPQTVQQYLREQARIATLFGIQPTQSPRPLCRGSVYARNNQFIRERTAIIASLRCAGTNPCQQLVRRARSGRSTLNASLLHPIFTRRQRHNSLIWNHPLMRLYGVVSFLYAQHYVRPVLPPDFYENSPFIQACIQQCLVIERRLGHYNPYRGDAPTFLELFNERCITMLQGIILGIQDSHQQAPHELIGCRLTCQKYTRLCEILFIIERHQQHIPHLPRMSTLLYYWGSPRAYRLTEEPPFITAAYQQLMQAGPLSGCDENAPLMQTLVEACITAEDHLLPRAISQNSTLATLLHHRYRFLYREHDQAEYEDIYGSDEGAHEVLTTCAEMLASFRAYLSS